MWYHWKRRKKKKVLNQNQKFQKMKQLKCQPSICRNYVKKIKIQTPKSPSNKKMID